MASEGIDIDLEKVVAIAEKLSSLNDEIHTVIQSMETEINSTPNNWNSRASKSLSSKYAKISKVKEDFYKDLGEYSKYLRNVAAEYGYTEKQINNSASEFM